MKPIDQITEEMEKKDKSKILTFLIFLLISTALWFLIKLTKDYSSQTVFNITYTEVPVNKWVSTPNQQVKCSFVADGFVTLRHNLVRKHKRVVEIPLNEVSYHLEGGVTYSYSSQYVAEHIAEWIGIPASNITMNEAVFQYGGLAVEGGCGVGAIGCQNTATIQRLRRTSGQSSNSDGVWT